MKPRLRKCKNKSCNTRFEPTQQKPFAIACCTGCEIVLAARMIEKAQAARAAKARKLLAEDRKAAADDRKKTKARLIELQPTKWHRANCKRAMHELVRAEAEGSPCISCDTILLKFGRHGGDYDAGHFRGVGRAKHLEFDRRNVWGQCKYCNDYLKGNYQEYERRLRLLKGDSWVDALLADNAPCHYKSHDYDAMAANFRAELKLFLAARTDQQGAA